MEIKSKRILVLSPHSDDMELGCGATINKLARFGNHIVNMVFTYPPFIPHEVIKEEVRAAQTYTEHYETVYVGTQDTQRSLDDLSVCRSMLRQSIWDYNKLYQPHIIFVPNSKDIHQSHQAVTEEARRIFKHVTIFGYELPWNSFGFDNQMYSNISQVNLVAKEQACREYKSQGMRDMFSREFITELASLRGLQAGCRYAECFEVIRLIV